MYTRICKDWQWRNQYLLLTDEDYETTLLWYTTELDSRRNTYRIAENRLGTPRYALRLI